MTEWFEETLYPDLGQRLAQSAVVFQERTPHQAVAIFDNPRLGRVLALDGVVQLTEADEYIHHEMLAHVPLLGHGAAGQVLIIGGGDGGVLRRVLQHPGVTRVTVVEIDRRIIDLSREYLPAVAGAAFDDPRTELVIEDGAVFVARNRDHYDVIIVDGTDPVGPGAILFSKGFFADCMRRLTHSGVLVTQTGVPFLQPDLARTSHQRLSALFADTALFLAPVPSYYGGALAFGWATENRALRPWTLADLQDRFAAAALPARYYTPELHLASFALPKDLHDLLAGTTA